MLTNIIFYLFFFIFGSIVGSFLNCLIYRLETSQSFLKGRSFCPYCRHILSFNDLIPIFSFIFLKGKCRYCQKKISLQYPLVEFFTGLIFVLIFHFLADNFQSLIYHLIISCFLISIFVFDLKHYLIPDSLIYPSILFSLFFQILFFKNQNLITNLFFSIIPSFFFLAIILFSKEKLMGFGDFKLAILTGLYLGWPKILISLFFSFLIGGIIGLILIILKKKSLKSEIPFAPFLISGTFFALFFDQKIIDWYFSFFLL